MLSPNEIVVMKGTFLYDGKIECDVRIIRSPMRYGSGDYEDPPEIRDDADEATFYVEYGSTTQRGVFNARGNGYASLFEAVASVKDVPGIGATLRWHSSL